MGATYRTAKSIGLVVLLAVIALAPLVSASDVRQTVYNAADDAQESAKETQAEAEKEAADQQSAAERSLAQTEDKAERQAEQTVAFAMTILSNGMSAIEDARDVVLDLLDNPTLLSLSGGRPYENPSAARSSSTDYAIVRPAITAPLVWMTASVSGLVILLVAARKLIGLGAIPLLSRIAHSDIYNNDARRTIHELVVGEPGQCLNELVGRTGYSRNAVSYHLFVLEKEEEIISVKDGKYRRYFTRNGKYVNGAKNVVAALRNETTLKLAKVVMDRPGSIQRDLCVELGATPSATCWHAKRLLDLGVIRKERVANTVKYYPGEAMSKYDLSDIGLPRLTLSPVAQPIQPANA